MSMYQLVSTPYDVSDTSAIFSLLGTILGIMPITVLSYMICFLTNLTFTLVALIALEGTPVIFGGPSIVVAAAIVGVMVAATTTMIGSATAAVVVLVVASSATVRVAAGAATTIATSTVASHFRIRHR